MLKNKKLLVVFLMFCLLFAANSCRKLETRILVPPNPPPPPTVLQAIPLDEGQLIAVTQHADDPHWAVLWFQKQDKAIAVVLVNVAQGKVIQRAAIPRN